MECRPSRRHGAAACVQVEAASAHASRVRIGAGNCTRPDPCPHATVKEYCGSAGGLPPFSRESDLKQRGIAKLAGFSNGQGERSSTPLPSKVVLIFGRFMPERKLFLDALREELRKPGRGYVPVVIDFEKSESRTTVETVALLVRMVRFVIADLSDAKSVLQCSTAGRPSMCLLKFLDRLLRRERARQLGAALITKATTERAGGRPRWRRKVTVRRHRDGSLHPLRSQAAPDAGSRIALAASSWICPSLLFSNSPRRSTARGDNSRSLVLITAGTPILPPGLALQPGSQWPRSSRSKTSFLQFEFDELEWTLSLLEITRREKRAPSGRTISVKVAAGVCPSAGRAAASSAARCRPTRSTTSRQPPSDDADIAASVDDLTAFMLGTHRRPFLSCDSAWLARYR